MNIINQSVQSLSYNLFKIIYPNCNNFNCNLEYYKEETDENSDKFNLIGLITIEKDIKINLTESTLDYLIKKFTSNESNTLIIREYEYDITLLETDDRYYIKLFFA